MPDDNRQCSATWKSTHGTRPKKYSLNDFEIGKFSILLYIYIYIYILYAIIIPIGHDLHVGLSITSRMTARVCSESAGRAVLLCSRNRNLDPHVKKSARLLLPQLFCSDGPRGAAASSTTPAKFLQASGQRRLVPVSPRRSFLLPLDAGALRPLDTSRSASQSKV